MSAAPSEAAPAPALPVRRAWTPEQFELSPATYQWSVRLFSVFRRLLRVNIELHGRRELLQEGEIFAFNHFSRFETFIPQYLIYEAVGAYCRSLASAEFFTGDAFSTYLSRVGAVPNDLPGLLPFLAKEVLRGRKVIVFPEGGMVKDRRVLDPDGEYRVYSRAAADRRKHRSGGAVLAALVDALKHEVRGFERRRESARIEEWADRIGLADPASLVAAAHRPTLIVPANITFYPIRVDDNVLRQVAGLLGRGVSPRTAEELLVEGNIVIRNTDMDIRLAEAVEVAGQWGEWERRIFASLAGAAGAPEQLLSFDPESGVRQRIAARWTRRKVARIRDLCTQQMYQAVTVNLNHLASRLFLVLAARGVREIEAERFGRWLYLGVKYLQTRPDVHLHRSLLDPGAYGGLPEGDCAGLQQFLEAKRNMHLLAVEDGRYRLLPELLAVHDFDVVRIRNLVAVYANEVAPVRAVEEALRHALASERELGAQGWVRARFDDMVRAHAWDREAFSGPRHAEINAGETATAPGSPFLALPRPRAALGVLLVHGFLASPAELRGLGDRVAEQGHCVLGVRLKGHGTSPWDLRERRLSDWLDSVRAGYAALRAITPRVCVVGFSAGGALALWLASERPPALAGVVAVSTPLRLRSRAMRLVPLVHGANSAMRWVSAPGVVPFRLNASEHPHINYRHIPVRGLYELRRLVEGLTAERLSAVRAPVLILQGDGDPVVDPASAEILRQRLPPDTTELAMVRSDRHGIVYEDIDGTQARILDYIARLEPAPAPAGEPAPRAEPS